MVLIRHKRKANMSDTELNECIDEAKQAFFDDPNYFLAIIEAARLRADKKIHKRQSLLKSV